MQVSFLCQLLNQEKIDVIHTHSVHTLDLALELGKMHGIPVVATCHYLDFQPLKTLAKANKIITISQEMKNKLHLPHRKTVTIENGVDTALIRPAKKNNFQPYAVFLARVTQEKEPAFRKLTELMIEYGWRIMSIGNWRPNNPEIVSRSWQANIAPYLRRADLVIGTGRAIREGMVAGCAACVLGDYFDGLVTPDNVEPLRKYNFSGRAFKINLPHPSATKIFKSLSDEQNLREVQHFSYLYGKDNFTLKDMVQKTIAVYQSTL